MDILRQLDNPITNHGFTMSAFNIFHRAVEIKDHWEVFLHDHNSNIEIQNTKFHENASDTEC